ncbi:MAG TPA: hypothetical protein VNT77_05630 [Allosphingosinicella sp.]|nr:hypothetical protein [Allosphingosinicella sp.]
MAGKGFAKTRLTCKFSMEAVDIHPRTCLLPPSLESMEQDGLLYLIIAAAILIGLIGLLLGMAWLRRRQTARGKGHLDVDMAEPETLDELGR